MAQVNRRRRRRVTVAKIGAYVLCVGYLALLARGHPPSLILGLAVVLTPLTLAAGCKLTVFLALSALSFALADPRERTAQLVCAISGLQPSSVGEHYREAQLASILDPDLPRIGATAWNLVIKAPATILEAWVSFLRDRYKRRGGKS
ncbi:MAG: hypothetical protein ACRDR6_10625 [Pseudonocardiaceae bacterium]